MHKKKGTEVPFESLLFKAAFFAQKKGNLKRNPTYVIYRKGGGGRVYAYAAAGATRTNSVCPPVDVRTNCEIRCASVKRMADESNVSDCLSLYVG